MKFLVDAQLPRLLALLLNAAGHDAIHTLDLLQQNKTSDNTIIDISISEDRIVVTKDTDFLDSYLLQQRPKQLVLVTTGNIQNAVLLNLFKAHLAKIVEMLQRCSLVEVTRTEIISHSQNR